VPARSLIANCGPSSTKIVELVYELASSGSCIVCTVGEMQHTFPTTDLRLIFPTTDLPKRRKRMLHHVESGESTSPLLSLQYQSPALTPFSNTTSFFFLLFFLSLLVARDVNHFQELRETFILDYVNALSIIPCFYAESFKFHSENLFLIIPYISVNIASVLMYVIPNWRILELSCSITYVMHHTLLICMVVNTNYHIEATLKHIIPILPIDTELVVDVEKNKKRFEGEYIAQIRQNRQLFIQIRDTLQVSCAINITIICVYVLTVTFGAYHQLTAFGSFSLWATFSYKSLIPILTTVRYNQIVLDYNRITLTNSSLSVKLFDLQPTPQMLTGLILTSVSNLFRAWASS
jgi:hypothetical protein